jgi:hypothetical protein
MEAPEGRMQEELRALHYSISRGDRNLLVYPHFSATTHAARVVLCQLT